MTFVSQHFKARLCLFIFTTLFLRLNECNRHGTTDYSYEYDSNSEFRDHEPEIYEDYLLLTTNSTYYGKLISAFNNFKSYLSDNKVEINYDYYSVSYDETLTCYIRAFDYQPYERPYFTNYNYEFIYCVLIRSISSLTCYWTPRVGR